MKSYKKIKAKTLGPGYRTPNSFRVSKFSGGNTTKAKSQNINPVSLKKIQHKG